MLGHVGRVIKVYPDGDLRVEVGTQIWTLNPACCTVAQQQTANMNNTNGAFDRPAESTSSMCEFTYIQSITY